MYTYIVIDDEPLIRRGTIKKLEGFPDVACIAQASNGQAALDLIKEKNPDFIITDMKMPVMDGTRLLPVLSTQYPDKHIIVISGYKDFEYAQQALRANTIDYIVKPFSRDTLWDAVSRAVSEIENKASLDQKLTMSETEKEILKYEYDRQLLKSLLFDSLGTSANFSSRKLNRLTAECCYFLITVNLQETLDENALSQFLSARSAASSCVMITRENTDNMAFLIFFLPKEQKSEYIRQAAAYKELLDLFFDSCHVHPFYGISQPHCSPESLHEAFRETAAALNQLTPIPACSYVFYEASENTSAPLAWPKLERFLFLVESGQPAEALILFPELFHYFARIEHCRLQDAKDYCMEIVEDLRKILPKDLQPPHSSAASLSLINNLNFIFSFQDLEEYFLQVFRNLAEAFENSGLYTEKDVMDNVRNYISLHYDKDLTLEFIASLFHLNRSYLSSAFKSRTGISFVDYVNQIRVEKAKELLAKTDKKTYQIAQAVGYENAKYFFRIFKKIEGITPEQYRKGGTSL